ncbi:hypothetical protein LPJ73_000645 [Coemansia sp. RSA 2703]|nr:hypothetical protein LPJ73_000645 [Coemansia sp. RSA 2703]KAJ2398183.1 hypothetical protein GGI05_000239 [Coemansia sp. RSA 2603]
MAKTLGRPVDIAFGSDITNSSAIIWDDLVVNPPNYVDMTGRLRIGGNLYSDLESEPSSSATSSNTPTDTPSSEPDRSASSGLGSTTKIIIGVVVPVAAIILAACVFIVCRVLNKKRADTNWRPQAEELHLREIANDLVVDDSVQPPNLRPPPYSASHGTRPPIRQSTVTTATMSSIAEEETSISEFERHDADNHDKK